MSDQDGNPEDWFSHNEAQSVAVLTANQVASGLTHGQDSLVVRKPVFGVSDQVQHKPGCTATEDG